MSTLERSSLCLEAVFRRPLRFVKYGNDIQE